MSDDLLQILLTQQRTNSSGTKTNHRDEAFKYRLELLKSEIDLIDRSLARDEARSQTIKILPL